MNKISIKLRHIISSWSGPVLFLYLLFFGNSIIAQLQPVITSKVDTTNIKIGEQIHFTVTVEVDSTAQVFFPEGQTFSPLETVEAFKTDTTTKKRQDNAAKNIRAYTI